MSSHEANALLSVRRMARRAPMKSSKSHAKIPAASVTLLHVARQGQQQLQLRSECLRIDSLYVCTVVLSLANSQSWGFHYDPERWD